MELKVKICIPHSVAIKYFYYFYRTACYTCYMTEYCHFTSKLFTCDIVTLIETNDKLETIESWLTTVICVDIRCRCNIWWVYCYCGYGMDFYFSVYLTYVRILMLSWNLNYANMYFIIMIFDNFLTWTQYI
jgi:hypothetical protein